MRNNALAALAIAAIIIIFVLDSDSTTTTTGIDLQENGVPVVSDISTLNFLSTANVRSAGNAGVIAIAQNTSIGQDVAEAHWVVPGWYCNLSQNITRVADQAYYVPVQPTRSINYDNIGLGVVTGAAGSVARLGIYNGVFVDNALEMGDLLLDAGTVSTATSGAKTISINTDLAGGQFYWLAFVVSSSSVAFTTCDATSAFTGPMEGFNLFANGTITRETLQQAGVGTAGLPVTPAPDASANALPIGIVKLRENP